MNHKATESLLISVKSGQWGLGNITLGIAVILHSSFDPIHAKIKHDPRSYVLSGSINETGHSYRIFRICVFHLRARRKWCIV